MQLTRSDVGFPGTQYLPGKFLLILSKAHRHVTIVSSQSKKFDVMKIKVNLLMKLLKKLKFRRRYKFQESHPQEEDVV